jgi:hypothetical protein
MRYVSVLVTSSNMQTHPGTAIDFKLRISNCSIVIIAHVCHAFAQPDHRLDGLVAWRVHKVARAVRTWEIGAAGNVCGGQAPASAL